MACRVRAVHISDLHSKCQERKPLGYRMYIGRCHYVLFIYTAVMYGPVRSVLSITLWRQNGDEVSLQLLCAFSRDWHHAVWTRRNMKCGMEVTVPLCHT